MCYNKGVLNKKLAEKFWEGGMVLSLLDFVEKSTLEYLEMFSKVDRKKYGQFFTSKESAKFMAEMFIVPKNKEEIYILDPGAGSGMLSVALVERLQKCVGVKKVNLICYETDDNIIPLLESNISYLARNTTIPLDYKVLRDNYITSQEKGYNFFSGALEKGRYDFVIANPPYVKIGKSAPEALAMPDVCYGAPNLYFLFMAMSLYNLKEDGEMVYIIPRSWTSGAYFKKFRDKLLNHGVIEHLHLFVSRDKVFEKENVLQETMIVKLKKKMLEPKYVTVTTSVSNSDFSDKSTFYAPYDTVVNKNDSFVYLITSAEEAGILEKLNRWKNNLPSLGLKMKTGLTVDFRNRDLLRNDECAETVPLFYAQHIKDGRVKFPIGKENEYIACAKGGLLQENTNYLFVKRFSSKEESRRLQCGIYLAKHFGAYERISTQNKINFICGLKELSECVVYGLYVLFNSTIYDRYYRILNGSTQVNSTEVNSMPVPPMNIIEKMGQELMYLKDMSVNSCDEILRSYI